MNPNFEDPNNHAPKVGDEDDWGDMEGAEKPAEEVPSVELPPKRAAKKAAAKKTAAKKQAKQPGKPKQPKAPKETKEAKAFEDPNNHAPEVSDADNWGGEAAAPGILPKKRAADEKPAGYHAPSTDGGDDVGVRVIDVSEKMPSDEPRDTVARLEVQELVPKLLAPEVPAPAKIVPKQVMPKPAEGDEPAPAVWQGRSAESESWGTEKQIPIRWMIVAGSALAAFIIAGVLLLPKLRWKGDVSRQTGFSSLEVFDEGPGEVAVSKTSLTEGIEDKAKHLAEAYVRARSVEEVLPLVRDRARVEAALKSRWKPFEDGVDWKVPDNSEWSLRKVEDREYGYLGGLLPDITPFRFIFVQEGEQAFLDWEASSGYSETTFPDLAKRKGEGGVTRCLLSPGDMYSFAMPETGYQCFRLASPDGENVVWGYVKRDDELLPKLVALFVQGDIPREILSEYAVTVRLAKAPEEALPNQWLIKELLHLEWITP